MKIYLISGLGADSEMFQKLRFPEGFEPVYINWIKPQKNESIQKYSERLSSQIDASEKFILIGLSFGGIIATEVGRILHPQKIILISSAGTHTQLPFYFKWIKSFSLHKLAPFSFLKQANFISYWFFGANTGEEKKLLKETLKKADTQFLKWAIEKILSWRNESRAENLVQIHGSKDRIIPYNKNHRDYKIANGGHLMIFSEADKVNDIIRHILDSVNA